MFSDLVGSTELSHQLDPEDLSAVIRDYQHEVERIVERFDGYIAQYLGDGVLIYFGFPRAHEHDAERAVRAGMEIVAAMRALDARWAATLNDPLQVRVGIHTGQVLIGEIGGGRRQEWLALGEAPPVAARILAVAPPGSVVVSAETRRLIGGRFDLEDLGLHNLKGISRPCAISRVLRVVDEASRFDAAASPELTPLVGRAQELALLQARWRLAQEGDGQVVLISGEAGLGKSRLLRELAHALSQEARATLRFECSPFAVNSAYQPIVDHLERSLDLAADAEQDGKLATLERHVIEECGLSPRHVALIAGPLGLHVDEHAALGQVSPTARKRETIAALVDLICAGAGDDGALMLFEDAHWADPTTLEFLDLLTVRAPSTRLLAIITYRPEFVPTWTRHGHVAAITLSNLSRGQAGSLISRLADGKALPAGLLEEIVGKAGGIPLFLEEVTRAVLESDQLRETDGRFELAADNAQLDVPVTLRASLMSRLDRHPGAKKVAQIGSVIGRTFDSALVGEVAPMDASTLTTGLDRLAQAGLIFRHGDGASATFTFKHALLQDLAYDSIPRVRRQSLHRSIAETMERGEGETRHAAPELLAYHWTHGGDAERAIPYWHRAGQNALVHHANVEAIGHLSRGIELLDELPETPPRTRQMLEMQIALGAPLIATKGYAASEVRDSFDRARELCRKMGPTPDLFHVLWGLAAFYLIRAELTTALELVQECLEQAEREADEGRLLEAHSWAGTIAFYLGEMATAQQHFDAALAIYDEAHHRLHAIEYGLDPAILCKVHVMWKLWLEGQIERALAEERDTTELAGRVAHPLSLVHTLNFATVHRQFRDEPEATKAIVEREIAISTEHQFPHYVAYATILGGWARAAMGDTGGGIQQIKEGLAARRATGAELARPFFLTLLAEAHRADGNPDAAIAALNEADAVIGRSGERWWEPEVHRLRGELLLDLLEEGEPDARAQEAESCFLQALEIARQQRSAALELRAAVGLLRLAQDAGTLDVEGARKGLARALAEIRPASGSAEVQEAETMLSAP